MSGTGGCDTCGGAGGGGCNAVGVIEIVQGYDKSFFVELFYLETALPYDLTGASQINVVLPGNPPVQLKLTNSKVTVAGAPGAGRIGVKVAGADSAALSPNPSQSQAQDLQVVVTNADTTKTVFVVPAVINVLPAPYGVV